MFERERTHLLPVAVNVRLESVEPDSVVGMRTRL